MPVKQSITVKRGLSEEGRAMDAALKKAARKAVKEAFRLRDAILVERDGWLMYVDAKGVMRRKVRRIKPVQSPD